ncbi:hypothetical protein [Rhodanobacter sp. T12-5]|uniref:hypothetical protein n=1 Tax=Rhodanobacter sp. T12-5 TaxID=2024611 RepID=UPI0018D93579|nr:hypothetical protein [Rhodanobacter sp. T12-5]
MSWTDYVRTHRLHLASRRLLESEQSIAAVAYSLGFPLRRISANCSIAASA